MNGLWYSNQKQYNKIKSFLIKEYDAKVNDTAIQTRIEPLETFYRAEDYHQKYHLRKHDRYMEYFEDHTEEEFTDSTLAARLNGILAGKADSLSHFDSINNLDLPDLLERDLRSRAS